MIPGQVSRKLGRFAVGKSLVQSQIHAVHPFPVLQMQLFCVSRPFAQNAANLRFPPLFANYAARFHRQHDLTQDRTYHLPPPKPYKTPLQTLQTLHAQSHDSPISRAIIAAWVRFLALTRPPKMRRSPFARLWRDARALLQRLTELKTQKYLASRNCRLRCCSAPSPADRPLAACRRSEDKPLPALSGRSNPRCVSLGFPHTSRST